MGTVKERNYLWDNMKAILIFLVVAGHLLEGLGPLDFPPAMAIDYWIYSFHIPAFIFVSGFLSKSYCKNGLVRSEKVTIFILYYAVFQVLFALLKAALNVNLNGSSFFDPCRGLWYLLAIIFYYLIIPIAEKIPSYITIGTFIILSILIGMEPQADNMLSIHRIFVFAPFFFFGYYLPSGIVDKIRAVKLPLRIVLGLLSMAASIFICVVQGVGSIPINVFFGKDNYNELKIGFLEGTMFRLEAIVIGLLMILAMLFIVPSVKCFLSYAGAHSLRVYIFHLPLVVVMMDAEMIQNIEINDLASLGILLLVAAAITAFLSLPFFEYPFKWMQLAVRKLYSLKDN